MAGGRTYIPSPRCACQELHWASRHRPNDAPILPSSAVELRRSEAVEQCGHCGEPWIAYKAALRAVAPNTNGSPERNGSRLGEELLETQYFHVVFTVHDEIAAIAFQNASTSTSKILSTRPPRRCGPSLSIGDISARHVTLISLRRSPACGVSYLPSYTTGNTTLRKMQSALLTSRKIKLHPSLGRASVSHFSIAQSDRGEKVWQQVGKICFTRQL